MIENVCQDCGMKYIDLYISECPNCKGRTKPFSKLYYCKNCQIPLYEEKCDLCGAKGAYLAADVRPVFPKERRLLEIILGKTFNEASVWAEARGNFYFIDGKAVHVNKKSLLAIGEKELEKITDELKVLDERLTLKFESEIQKFIDANKKHIDELAFKTKEFINKISSGFKLDEMFVSFSGGKDSTVVSDLVTKALGSPKVIHIFGDTTLEFPFTLDYITRFREKNPYTPLIIAKNKESSFFDMCELLGPPSRVMRWCCTIFKTGPINKKIAQLFKGKKKVITFYGIRRGESVNRSKYSDVTVSPKILKQVVVSPIFNWTEFDIWLYILANGIDFNEAYRLGYSRVGCWCCPNNSVWSQFLTRIYMAEMNEKWEKFLIDFARRIGKEDAEVYVREGKWKARQGGSGVDYSRKSVLTFKPCSNDENTLYYDLQKPISKQLYEFFKPFGELNFEMGQEILGEVFVLDEDKNVVMKLQGLEGDTQLKIVLYNAKNTRIFKQKIEAQITKFQMCIGCLACEGVCHFGAIKVSCDDYRIDEKKCTRCGKCISYFDGGCYIRKVLTIKRGD
ncbi:phosphoadenosine phosphosulfate reductase [Thermosyntropha lipolytica DSM 11003]|uniref:Phosphoadenosine phosphosulfate reductase n=1 Tax=Thermosyntropha lipolytica DSM 11003 TaxID=1123382 RepID=A0A1M5QXJ4_9FIRM|nr:phosphoadenosine phosphosulfate reductase family protein [Thermosyntropha lipolytica]SHH18897.1 phosphoadenosine phosphosulfate reductase [Thermosyntropha lipolytica DSM 11003]